MGKGLRRRYAAERPPEFDAEHLAYLARLEDDLRVRRARVLRMYARLRNNGLPEYCRPPDRKKKVIFNTEKAAGLACAELVRAGTLVVYPYRCTHGGYVHWHMTSQSQKGE